MFCLGRHRGGTFERAANRGNRSQGSHEVRWSQAELGERVGRSRVTIMRWESGEREPSTGEISQVASALGTSIAYLLGETDDPSSPSSVVGSRSVGNRICDARKKRGKTQAELAELVEVQETTIHKWESNKQIPRVSEIYKLDSVLNIDVSFFLDGSKGPAGFSSGMLLQKQIGTRIKKARERNGISIEEYREKYINDAIDIKMIEDGVEPITYEGYVIIAKRLGVTMEYLIGETNDPTEALTLKNLDMGLEAETNNNMNIIAGDVSHAAVVQGVNNGTVSINNSHERVLSEEAAELLRIFELFDVKRRMKVLELAFVLEEEVNQNHKS